MRNYKELEVWNKSHGLVKTVYKKIIFESKTEERFDLIRQLKRAAYSIPLNIVEGCGKFTNKDFTKYLDNALGSAHETEYCLTLLYELEFIDKEIFLEINGVVNEIKAMLIAFIKYLRRTSN